LTADACKGGCGGLWFDNFELSRVDEPHEAAGAALLDIPVDPAVSVDRAKRRSCPRCHGVVLMRHFFSPRRSVEVDHCPACNGYWLDRGELAAIRGEYASAVDRDHAVQDFIAELFEHALTNKK